VDAAESLAPRGHRGGRGEPGPLNYFCLNVMFISSVSTVLFNANPLLRYDGYYILSDILEIPNLRQKASTILSRKFGKWCLGLEEPDDPFLPKRKQWLFALYTVAAALYRWVVVLSILFFLNKVFEPIGLKILGQLIALGAIYGLLVQPFVKMYKYFKVPGRLAKVKRARLYGTLSVLALLVGVVFLVRLPSHVYCPVEVQARDAENVVVSFDGGILEEVFVKPGDKVAAGQKLARLRNVDLDLMILSLKGERDTLAAQLEGLERVASQDVRASVEIGKVVELLRVKDQMIAQHELDRARLTLKAPIAGTVLPPPRLPEQELNDDELPEWSGSPMDDVNLGATLAKGTPFCQIGDPGRMEARLIIDQGDIEFVRSPYRQKVEMMMAQSADFAYITYVEGVSGENLKVSPTHLSSLNGGELPTQMSATGVPEPLSAVIEGIAPLPINDPHGLLRIGLVGRAKIHTESRTIAARFWRYVRKTFNFDL
jgi:putative peptide zinc metalloprotease protein